jgi:serine protease
MRNRLIVTWTLLATLLATVLVVTSLRASGSEGPGASAAGPTASSTPDDPGGEPDIPAPDVPPSPDQVSFAVDAGLHPAIATIDPVHEGGSPRPIARLRSTGGVESDVVLGELTVSVRSDDELDAFLGRWNGQLIDTVPADEGDEYTDHLVSVDPSTAMLDQLAVDLLAVEPHHAGVFAASDDDAFALMAIAAHETATHGTLVTMNWLTPSSGVAEGTSAEDPGRESETDPNRRSDAFTWNWISSTAPQASGIDAAWQLLRWNVGNRVKIMIVDNGFFYNEDLPLEAKIRHGEWRVENPGKCSNDSDCPFHGTDVAMAAMGRVDNGFGTAGPASNVADLIAMSRSGSTYEQLKAIRKVADEERPDVINMSFGGNVTTFQGSAERIYGRWFKKVRDDYGALAFAASGNDGIDVDNNDALTVPCELPGVVCVGGVDGDAVRHDGSNYGTKTGSGSVEIYGPFCVYALQNPDVPGDSSTKTTCGTSVASPVVAGVAALVMAANPTLGPTEVWQIMKDTAHDDSLGTEIGGGHHRRIDAYRAVATAMGRPYTLPTITIHGPTADDQIGPNDFFDLDASAENFAGLDLAIQWTRPGGELVNGAPTTDPVTVGELGPGTHTFIASATDVMGLTMTRTLNVQIANTPPTVSISSPAANTYRYTVEEVLLDGSTSDADELWAALSDDAVTWSVRREGSTDVVFETTGHQSAIPANTLSAGDYEVRFRGADPAGQAIVDTALLTMLAVPAGESLPKPTMISPTIDEQHATGPGGTAAVRLRATATDVQDGSIDGRRMRWTAEQGDTRIVLCEGSDLSTGGGGIAVDQDCSDVTVQLEIPPESPWNSRWTITVEVVDSAGLPGRTSRAVTVQDIEG